MAQRNAPLNLAYCESLKRHSEQVLELLGPRGEDAKPDEDSEFLASFLYPNSYWTAREKEQFFRALTRYSRLRPDLIAASIRSKNTLDVVAYLDALDRAAELQQKEEEDADQHVEQQGDNAEGGEKGGRRRRGRDAMAAAPFAKEMSEEWVEFEQGQADVLEWILPDRSGDDHMLVTGDRTFNTPELEVMEGWIRAVHDASLNLAAVPESIRATYESTQGGADAHAQRREGSASPQPVRTRSRSRSVTPANAQAATPVQPAQASSSSSFNQPQTGVRILELTDAKMNVDEEGNVDLEDGEKAEDNVEEGLNLDNLDPATRRRLKKRLYMRRQRALKAGKTADMTSVKLQPGRQTKLRRPKNEKERTKKVRFETPENPPPPSPANSNPSTPISGKDANSVPLEVEDDPDVEYASGQKGGMTAFTRAKHDLQEDGIDGETLVEEGIGFLNLNVLAKLIRIFTSDHREEYGDSLDVKKPGISASTIRLLSDIAAEFITEVVSRTLRTSMHQASLKRNTKAWRIRADSRTISVEDIRDTLEMMGARMISKAEYCAKLLDEPMEAAESSNDEDSVYPTDSSVHQRLFAPHIYLPPSYQHLPEDSIEDEDPDEFREQCLADKMLDAKDLRKSIDYESDLWEEYELA
ncbi:hypothetical protein FA15DRAFT_667334 [Coprinopsis marcescibilis]|uniref:Uncharacterized protein n=1 Tax=Coprinopsis marcescibilis TaxID=230819 RepID=A0A5C3L0M5_COPMA|nr:hypothetical protein FA15DRAFT_667334 [Coprinopsis marcescibilis]